MSRKNFKTSFDSLLGDAVTYTKPKRNTPQSEVRATFIIREVYQEKLKSVAYYDRKKIKDVLDEALSNYFEAYEKKNGAIKSPK
jgi:hypothetical protein